MDELKYKVHETGDNIDEAIRKILDLQFMTAPTAINKVATNANLPTIPLSGLLKADGEGGMTVAIEDIDYQIPLPFIHAPSALNPVLTALDAVHDIIYSNAAPIDGTTDVDKVGQIYCHQKTGGASDWYIGIDTTAKKWFLACSIKLTVHTDIITTSGTWTAPECVNQAFDVKVIGGGGGGQNSYKSGGAGGCLEKDVLTIAAGETVSVTVGAGGTIGSYGGSSSFGSYISAVGGPGANTMNGANAYIGNRHGMGGGGGGGGNYTSQGNGGNGGYYGGGGGGAGTQGRQQGGIGGNGGYYGGGGGGGGNGSSSASVISGGSGGTYGGGGGAGGNASTQPTSGSAGTNTVGLGLDFVGIGASGAGASTSYGGGGGGGGGYGGNGGNGSGGTYGTGGGGGGGYGGNGGDGVTGGSYHVCGGGGGGYGGNANGAGGGGYGATNYGAGGNGDAGNAGAIIVSYQILEAVWNGRLA